MADPQPPPEAALITRRIDGMIPPPSRAQLARDAGISAALWAKIEKGYDQPSAGVRIPYRGSAKSVAAMARVLGITAADLRRCKRPDAARIAGAMPAPVPEHDANKAVDERLDNMERKMDLLLRRLGAREAEDDPDEDNGSRNAV